MMKEKDEIRSTSPGEFMAEYKKMADGIARWMNKKTRGRTYIAAARLMALSALASHEKGIMLENGYTHDEIDAWVDVGDRYGEATRRGWASETDMDAFHQAFGGGTSQRRREVN